MAFQNAKELGTDPSTQNGALIIDDEGWILGEGANFFPRGVKESEERWQRPTKYSFVEHAERNAIFHAAREGHTLEGATMYVCWYACSDCARAIIQSGIKEVVGHKKCFDLTPDHWKESIKTAFVMLEEAGVKTRTIEDEVGVTIRFNGNDEKF